MARGLTCRRRCAAAVAGVVAVIFLASAPPSFAEQECAYIEAGDAGPIGNVLRVTGPPYSEPAILRKGQNVLVLNVNENPTSCSGPQATVTNIDSIDFEYAGDQPYGPVINLRAGPFAPGASAEADGTSEIEMSLLGSTSTSIFFVGSSGRDNIEAGTLPGGEIGINLNAGEETPDVDVTMPDEGILGGSFRDGNDRFDASGGALAPGSPAAVELFLRNGGPGSDELVAGSVGSYIVGGLGGDRIVGGAGSDRTLAGGLGDDTVLARGGGRDALLCGGDRDRYSASGEDRVFDCERRVTG